MIDLETIKKEVYKNEKSKMVKKLILFNFAAFLILYVSLSGVNPPSSFETRLLSDLKKETKVVSNERDSLKNLVLNVLDSMRTKENDLIRKSLGLSLDTSYHYNDLNSSVSDIYSAVNKQASDYKEMDEKIKTKTDSILSVPTINPVSSADFIKITDGFGYRKHPFYKKWIFHEGIDIAAEKRTDVFSTADGVVEKVYYSNVGYGNRVIVKHKYGYKTVYAHLVKIDVEQGQRLKKGTKIGYVGSTGLSTANHLHYEILLNNRPVNPLEYFDVNRDYIAKR